MTGLQLKKEVKQVDEALRLIADYVSDYQVDSDTAYDTARACLMDTLGCGILALKYPECTKLLGPIIPGTTVPGGSRVPGTPHVLDPVHAAFNIGTMIRWLDFNDTWLAAEWGHPSDNLGGILSVADYLSQKYEEHPFAMRDVLTAMIKAHEIQGILALENSFNRIGFDHVILVKIATTAVVTAMLGGTREQIVNALSNAWIDTGPLRTYRHTPNTGSRKSWAAGDATSRGVRLGMMTMQGEMGYATALTAPKWGLYDVLFDGTPFTIERPFGSYVMENVLFKLSYPAEFHAQTAVESAVQLHPNIKGSLDEIEKIDIHTHESAIRIIDKTGPLHNPADRDHCLQYMVAIGLLHGGLTADHYEEETAQDPRIDRLREKMHVQENPQYSIDYLNPEKRSIANAITIYMKDGKRYGPIAVEYPIGHRRRRAEGLPVLHEKFRNNMVTRYDKHRVELMLELIDDPDRLDTLAAHKFLNLWL